MNAAENQKTSSDLKEVNEIFISKKSEMIEEIHQLILSGNCSILEQNLTLPDFEKHQLTALFLEMRSKPFQESGFNTGEIYVCCQGSRKNLDTVLKQLEVMDIEIKMKKSNPISKIWFPRNIASLNRCRSVTSEVEPHLDSNHPGFKDQTYRHRRQYICNLSKNHTIEKDIPNVEYNEDEIKTWNVVYTGLKQHHQKWACAEYLQCFKQLEQKGIYSPDFIPQLNDVSKHIKECTGFQLCPVSGLLSPRDFLASLAFKVFQCTQYIRHHTSPMHTPEPDCCHELLGHVPMLCDPVFATFSQEVGLASLGASDDDITKLATLYWFTVEFGLCKEDGNLKAYGAALLSSFGELEHAISNVPEHLPLDVDRTSVQPYQDVVYQPVYFVANSFEEAKTQVRTFSEKSIKRNFKVAYNEDSQSIEVIPKIF